VVNNPGVDFFSCCVVISFGGNFGFTGIFVVFTHNKRSGGIKSGILVYRNIGRELV